MNNIIERYRVDPPPTADTRGGGRDRPLLSLRLSDGATWAHEFGASTADELRDGCFEAWVACRLEWQRRADLLPAHQTMKRSAVLASMPTALQLHVRDTSGGRLGDWIDANHAVDPMRRLAVLHPGTATNAEAWSDASWLDTWGRCLKSWWSAAELARFLGSTLPRMLRDELGDGAAAAG